MNEHGTTRLVNNSHSSLAKSRTLIRVDSIFTKMNDLNNRQTNVIKNLEIISSNIKRPLVNQVTKEMNVSTYANLDLHRNFNTFPLVHAHSLKNPKKVTIGHLNIIP